jgi:hypothetical protein
MEPLPEVKFEVGNCSKETHNEKPLLEAGVGFRVAER